VLSIYRSVRYRAWKCILITESVRTDAAWCGISVMHADVSTNYCIGAGLGSGKAWHVISGSGSSSHYEGARLMRLNGRYRYRAADVSVSPTRLPHEVTLAYPAVSTRNINRGRVQHSGAQRIALALRLPFPHHVQEEAERKHPPNCVPSVEVKRA
jgi:hypothetical protein